MVVLAVVLLLQEEFSVAGFVCKKLRQVQVFRSELVVCQHGRYFPIGTSGAAAVIDRHLIGTPKRQP
jgi:hypothetical protein